MSFKVCNILKEVNAKKCIYVICVFLPFVLSPLAASPYKESRCGYVMLLVASYWLLEPVPLAVTALLPVVLFPLLGVIGSHEVCSHYMKESFMMFIGGLIMAIAIEDCKLHERMALRVLLLIGTDFKWLMMGIMLTTMFLSMWIGNLSVTAMMIAIVEPLLLELSRGEDEDDIELEEKGNFQLESKDVEVYKVDIGSFKIPRKDPQISNELSRIKIGFLLGVCYAANIGGTGTLIGGNANIVLKTFLEERYPECEDITFASWMMYSVPGMFLCTTIGWFYLWMIFIRCSNRRYVVQSKGNIKKIILKRYSDLGPISIHEAQVLVLLIILVSLWVFRDPKVITGWADAIGSDVKIGNSFPSILISFLLFFLPANPEDLGGRRILEWKTAQAQIPWGVILLLGGGFALADATQKSGLSRLLGTRLSALSVLSPGTIVIVICFMTAMVTEIMTNTITASILCPVFNQMALLIGVNPLFLLIPVTVSCSYAFMLPVATPPNALALERGNMRTIDMVKSGLVMNLICCAVQILMLNSLGVVMFDLNVYPSWANRSEMLFTSPAEVSSYENATLSSLSVKNYA